MTDVEKAERYVAHLEALAKREDRASLARLRRASGKPPGTVPEALPLIVPFLPGDQHEHWAYFVLGPLFAMHPESAHEGNMGTTYRGFGDHESASKRFVALLNCHEDELATHLRQAISLAKSKQIPVNYRQLLKDIINCTQPNRVVQHR